MNDLGWVPPFADDSTLPDEERATLDRARALIPVSPSAHRPPRRRGNCRR